MTIEPRSRTAILSVLSLLVRREYVALAKMTGNQRLTAGMLAEAVSEYGRTVSMPPNDDLPPDLEFVPEEAHPERVHAVMSLWTAEEGESDLGLELTLIRNRHDVLEIQIDGLHVL